MPPVKPHTVDLNADLGEGAEVAADASLLGLVTSANVACGFHAGDPLTMARIVALARERGVAIGAHPSFPDREGFGRRAMVVSTAEVQAQVIYQIGAMLGFCRAAGVTLQHVKLHGALYNQAAKDRELAQAVVRAIRVFDCDLILFAPPGSELDREGGRAGLRVATLLAQPRPKAFPAVWPVRPQRRQVAPTPVPRLLRASPTPALR